MATAAIRIDQPTHTTQPTGVVGRARDDIEISEAVTLRNGDNTGVTSWRWEMLYKPTGSTAVLTNPVLSTASFTPDLVGTYRVRLSVNEGLEGEVDTTVAIVRDSDGLRIPAFGEELEADYVLDGAVNAKGWHPDFEGYMAFLKAAIASAAALPANGTVIYDVDFTAQGSSTIVDGNFVIDGKTWVASNIASRTTTAEIGATGILLEHATGSTSQIAGGDTAPRLSIDLPSLIDNYAPTNRYMFIIQWSWSTAPNQSGERFSFGLYGAGGTPNASCALRFAGATANYNSAGSVAVEGERDNTISNSRSSSMPVIALALDSQTELAVFSAASWPSAISSLDPVVAQRATNLTAAGDYNIMNHPDNRFVMALAATGSTATHAVLIERLQIIQR